MNILSVFIFSHPVRLRSFPHVFWIKSRNTPCDNWCMLDIFNNVLFPGSTSQHPIPNTDNSGWISAKAMKGLTRSNPLQPLIIPIGHTILREFSRSCWSIGFGEIQVVTRPWKYWQHMLRFTYSCTRRQQGFAEPIQAVNSCWMEHAKAYNDGYRIRL